MDNFNKLISFFLGLVVVIIFFAVVTGRINLKNKLPFISRSTTITPTPKTKITPTPISTVKISDKNYISEYNQYSKTIKKPQSIPATGLSTEFTLVVSSLLGLGIFLKTTKPRNF